MTNTLLSLSNPGNSRLVLFLVAAALLCAIAFGVQLYMTPYGAAVSPDSVKYISAARNLAEGNGLLQLADDGELVPLTLWAPLYPVLLSWGVRVGLDPWEFGRYLNAFLFAANLILLQLLLFRMTHGGMWATIIGAFVMILSPIVLQVHTWIWTEPLAILLGFGSLLVLRRYFLRNSVVDLVLVGVLLALSLLNRYAAIAFPLTVILSIALAGKTHGDLRRWKELLIVCSIAFIPFVVLMIRNAAIEVGAVGRAVIFNPGSVADALEDAVAAISVWTVPGRIKGFGRDVLSITITLLWFGLVSWGIIKERWPENQTRSQRITLPQSLYIFLLCSILPPIVVNIFFSPGVHVDERVLSLAYIAGVLLSMYFLTAMILRIRAVLASGIHAKLFLGIMFRTGLLAVGATIIALNAVHALDWVRDAQEDGRGYAQLSWQDSKVIAYLEEHPGEAILITNVPDAIIFLTGQRAIMMPDSTEGIVDLVAEPASDGGGGEKKSYWIVYFRTRINRLRVPSEVALTTQLELEPIYGSETGSIYALSTTSH